MVPVPVVRVGEVRVLVTHRLMPMPVLVCCTHCDRRVMRVLVVRVVFVFVFVFQ